ATVDVEDDIPVKDKMRVFPPWKQEVLDKVAAELKIAPKYRDKVCKIGRVFTELKYELLDENGKSIGWQHTRSKEKDIVKCNVVRYFGKNRLLVTNSRFSNFQDSGHSRNSRMSRRGENQRDPPEEEEVQMHLDRFERGNADV